MASGDIPQRVLQAQISLAQSGAGATGQQTTYQGTSSNTATLSNLRMSAKIVHAGGAFDSTMDLSIFGMTRSMMQQLSTLGMQLNLVPKNPITLMAGNAGENLAVAFSGYIMTATPNYNAAPLVDLKILAQCALPQAVIKATPTSFKGAASVANIMAGLASNMGLKFENSGVTAMVNNPYYAGSYRDQMQACAREVGINATILNGTLAIWPKNGTRNGQIPIIAPPPNGNMIGYPTYTANGIMLRNVYDPSIGFGQSVQVQSSVLNTSTFSIYGLDHDLECQVPKGKWESTILGFNPKAPAPVLN